MTGPVSGSLLNTYVEHKDAVTAVSVATGLALAILGLRMQDTLPTWSMYTLTVGGAGLSVTSIALHTFTPSLLVRHVAYQDRQGIALRRGDVMCTVSPQGQVTLTRNSLHLIAKGGGISYVSYRFEVYPVLDGGVELRYLGEFIMLKNNKKLSGNTQVGEVEYNCAKLFQDSPVVQKISDLSFFSYVTLEDIGGWTLKYIWQDQKPSHLMKGFSEDLSNLPTSLVRPKKRWTEVYFYPSQVKWCVDRCHVDFEHKKTVKKSPQQLSVMKEKAFMDAVSHVAGDFKVGEKKKN